MQLNSKQKLRRATIIYWVMLAYILAALIWWFISLLDQNQRLHDLRVLRANSPAEARNINEEFKRDRTKFYGEGGFFFLLIIVGAVFVYRSVRRQFLVQQQQQNFMMAVTHELKTPISVTRLNLETLQKYNLDPEKQKKLIRMTLEETGRLNTLTNNILTTSQLEGEGYISSKEELDLSALLKDCIQDFRNRYPERVFLEIIETEAAVKGDPLLLQILINNLLENALKYSPKEHPVTAILRQEKEIIQLQIIDEGFGIAKEERKNVFTKFYRIGNEATRKTQGTGLGLYLCQRIAKYHNADISVTNNTPAGSIFAVRFHSENE